ncbi:MAG: ABC transporter permease [Solirubrobacterales bacterium]|nr:ABC transporter permease [Solirubrobacterales bacterium]
MSLAEQLGLAVQALRANWLRGLLTALGVIIGVASLVTLTAISAGAREGVATDLKRLGPNIVLLDGEFITLPNGVTTPTDRTLTRGDLEAVARLPSVRAVAARQVVEGLTISSGRVRTSPFVSGVSPDYLRIHNVTAAQGRLLTRDDNRFGREVIVLGSIPARRLFRAAAAVGHTVRVLDREFTVVGVYARRGSLGGENLDNNAFLPLTVAKRVLFGGDNVHGADVQVASAADVAPTMDAIDSLMAERHKIGGGLEDWSTEDQAQIINAAQAATSTFQTLTLALGAIALIVGGIGIMNIMLVSVTERTREIGIRKALGADPRHIQGQFLTEALVLCTAGGALGVGLGLAVARVVSSLAGWQTVIAPGTLVVAFATALAVGLFFGFYPARRAARLPPAVAMRYD